MRNLINQHSTYHELPDTVAPSVLASLIQQHKPNWAGFTRGCLDAVSERLEQECGAHVKGIFHAYPGACGAVM